MFALSSDSQDEAPEPILPGHPEEDPDGKGDGGDVQHHEVGDEMHFLCFLKILARTC